MLDLKDMEDHREELECLLKMIWNTLKAEEEYNRENYKGDGCKIRGSIRLETIFTIRELTRMFIKKINSVKMVCGKEDDIILEIESIVEWLNRISNYILKNLKTESEDVKVLKLVNQLIEDYMELYNNAQNQYRNAETKEWYVHHFDFGKKAIMYFTKDGVNIKNGESLAIIHDDPLIISPEYTKKIDEMYEWIKTQKENQFTEDKLIKAMGKYFDKESRRFKE